MAELNIEKEVINYRNRFLKSVIHDLFIKYEKRNLLYIVAECIHEIYGNYPINTEADGSQWLSLDDYEGGLTQLAADGETCPDATHNFIRYWHSNFKFCPHCGIRFPAAKA